MSGFDLDDVRDAVDGPSNPEAVRVVFEQHIDEEFTLTGDVGHEPGDNVREVLDQNGVLDQLEEVEEALQNKGHRTPDGYTVRVLDEDGDEIDEATDIESAMSLSVEAGQTIVLSGQVSGAQ